MRIPGVLLACVLALPMVADEGMWLFSQFPKEQVKRSYNFEVTGQFLENLRLASLRIGPNAGSLVSPSGLILTDRAAVADCAAKDGFYAATQAEELRCPGLEASVLVGLEDVTAQVKESPPAKEAPKSVKAAAIERRNAIARLEKTCAEKTGNTCTCLLYTSRARAKAVPGIRSPSRCWPLPSC